MGLVQRIEELPLDIYDRVDLLLFLAKEKPTTRITLYHACNCAYDPQRKVYALDDALVTEVDDVLDNMKTPYHKLKKELVPKDLCECDCNAKEVANNEKMERAFRLIGRNRSWLTRLSRAHKQNDKEELGLCFGYPQTSVEAFVYGEIGPRPEDPMLDFFLLFDPSKDHFKEEYKLARIWRHTIHTLSPRTYRDVKEHVMN